MTTWAGLTVTIATKVLLCISAASPFDNESNQYDTAPHIMWVHTVHGIEYISYNNLQGAQVAQSIRSLDLTAHTSLSQHGFAPSFVIYKKGWTRLAAASDTAYQLLPQGRWLSPGTPASSTAKTVRDDIAEILLKVDLDIKIQIQIQIIFSSFWRTFLIRNLKGLTFDCLSFTEGLITWLSTVDSEAPASSNTSVTSLCPFHAAKCRGVLS